MRICEPEVSGGLGQISYGSAKGKKVRRCGHTMCSIVNPGKACGAGAHNDYALAGDERRVEEGDGMELS